MLIFLPSYLSDLCILCMYSQEQCIQSKTAQEELERRLQQLQQEINEVNEKVKNAEVEEFSIMRNELEGTNADLYRKMKVCVHARMGVLVC